MKSPAASGTWRSPITADRVVLGAVRVGGIVTDASAVYVSESRPAEGGRTAIVRIDGAGETELLPAPFDARSRVHEYGGGAFTVDRGELIFVNLGDQQLYRLAPGSTPAPITGAAGTRHAAPTVDRQRGRVVCVAERGGPDAEPENALISVNARQPAETWTLASGRDFYASPRLSPDGAHLAWLEWDHPNMPWDGTDLVMAHVDEAGHIHGARRVAGGPNESIFQPEWGPEGELLFVSDRGGYWNPFVLTGSEPRPLIEMEAEFGLPQWAFEMSTYAVLPDGRLVCALSERGSWHLGVVDRGQGALSRIDTPYTEITGLRTRGATVVFVGASPTRDPALVELDVTTGRTRELRRFSDSSLDPQLVSVPEAIAFPTTGGAVAHALYYPPNHPEYRPLDGELPPLLVKSHGGPTGAASTALSLKTQYYTSRGIGVLDVNYRGSTGHGRQYRAALDGAWGVIDVDDCIAAARYLVERGDADPKRLLITGGSAGGYTTLAALTFHDVFRAGASHYGISDLETLARDTHKFESRYLDRLVGPYPEARDLYRARSPIHHTEGLSCPVIFFQGLEDRVVPPNQAEAMVAALERKRIPVAHLAFPGEGHGFRRAENIRRSVEAELWFYGRILGFEPADPIEPVAITGL